MFYQNFIRSHLRFHLLLPKQLQSLNPTIFFRSEANVCSEWDVNVYNINIYTSQQMQIRSSLSHVREQVAHIRVQILLLL